MQLLFFLILLQPQDYTHRGFVESNLATYPQTAPNDAARVVGEMLFVYEGFYKPRPDLQFAGMVGARTDSHHQTERSFHFDWQDRGRRRPAIHLRRLSAQYHRGGFTLEAGKQFVRWGRTDIINPTDRFAPRDFLNVVDSEFLGIAAVRGTYEHGSNTLDVVWSPRLTPSRLPLPDQRWGAPTGPAAPNGLSIYREIPTGSQTGVRWSHSGFVEFAAAFSSAYGHVPSYSAGASPLTIREFHARQSMFGGDIGVPLPWFTVKAEGGYFQSNEIDDHLLYVVQIERQSGEWFLVGGYGGEVSVSRDSQSASFDPDRSMLRTILGRASYTIDVNRSVAFEAAIRRNGDGAWIKGEYSQTFGQHFRLTAGASVVRGKPSDFLGQYRRNSQGLVSVRYSF